MNNQANRGNNGKVVYNGTLMGDVATEEQIFGNGNPIELSPSQAGAIAFDDQPFKQLIAESTPEGSGTPTGKAARIAAIAGSNIGTVKLPHISVANGLIHVNATTAKVAGGAVKALLERFAQDYPVRSLTRTAPGDALGSDVVITLSDADAALLGFSSVAIPLVFISVMSKADSVRPGASIGIKIEGVGHTGGALSSLVDIVKRSNGSQALEVMILPHIKTGETLAPQLASFGDDNGTPIDFKVTVTGLLEGDSVQITTPGFDSVQYAAYLQRFGLNLL